jgi:hypothetical protein
MTVFFHTAMKTSNFLVDSYGSEECLVASPFEENYEPEMWDSPLVKKDYAP